MKVSELLSSRDRWAQGYLKSNPVLMGFEAYCLMGAVDKLYPSKSGFDSAMRLLRDSIRRRFPDSPWGVAEFNDTHTYEEVMQVVRDADV